MQGLRLTRMQFVMTGLAARNKSERQPMTNLRRMQRECASSVKACMMPSIGTLYNSQYLSLREADICRAIPVTSTETLPTHSLKIKPLRFVCSWERHFPNPLGRMRSFKPVRDAVAGGRGDRHTMKVVSCFCNQISVYVL